MGLSDEMLKQAWKDWPDFPRLDGIHELDHEYRLGLLYVHKHEGRYRFGYGFDTSEGSRFLKRRMLFPDSGIDAWGVVFRQFDRFDTPNDPPEFAIGWVPVEQGEELDGWIEFLNEQLVVQRQRRIKASGGPPASAARADSY